MLFRKSYFAASVVLVIAVIAIAAYFVYRGSSSPFSNANNMASRYGSITGYSTTAALITEMKRYSVVDSDQAIATKLLDEQLYTRMGEAIGISFTDTQVKAEVAARNGSTPEHDNPYIDRVVHLSMLKSAIETAFVGHVTGKLIIAHFDQFILVKGSEAARSQAELSRTPAQQSVLLADIKQYASNYINKLYTELQSGQLSFDQGIIRTLADVRLGRVALPSLAPSGDFDTLNDTDLQYGMTNQPVIQAALASTPVGGISKPVLGQIADDVNSETSKTDGYYAIFQVLTRSTGKMPYASPAVMLTKFKLSQHYMRPQL